MSDPRTLLERESRRFVQADGAYERLTQRRDRKRRNQRITAGVVGITVFVAAIWVVTSGSLLDRSEMSVGPAGSVTGPAETGPVETGVENPEPPRLVEPVPVGTVTNSEAGCTLEITVETIPEGPGRLTVVNDTDRATSFDLFYLNTDVMTFSELEEIISTGESYYGREVFDPSPPRSLGPAATVLTEREVGPGVSGTIVDNFASGDTYAVVCAHPGESAPRAENPLFGKFIPLFGTTVPFDVVGPIVVP